MDIKDAQKKVDELILHYGGYWDPLSMMARLTEENGEVARAMNIKHGGKKAKSKDDGRDIEKELSDLLFTILAISNLEKVNIDKEFTKKIQEDYDKLKGIYYE